MCDDLEATMAELRAKGVELGPVSDQGWGRARRSHLRTAASSASTGEASGALADYDRDVVSTLVIRLLGPPEIERDGVVVASAAWSQGVGRARVSGPGGAAGVARRGWPRWSSATPRIRSGRCAGRWRSCVARSAWPARCAGDPLELGLPPGTAVDVLALAAGEPDPALVRGELLEGIDPGAGAGVRRVAAGRAPAPGGRLRGRVEGRGAGCVGCRWSARRCGAGVSRASR